MTQEEAYLRFAEAQRTRRKDRVEGIDDDLDSALSKLQDMASMDAPDNEHWLVCVVEMRKLYAYFQIYCMEE